MIIRSTPTSNQFLSTPQVVQERVLELEATLAHYREQFGDLPKLGEATMRTMIKNDYIVIILILTSPTF